MDVTEITRAGWGPVGRVQRRLGRAGAPASLRAQIALVVSALLLGGVLSALLFVGVWRHTATEGDRARAAQAESRQALQAARSKLARSERQLASAHAAIGKLTAERALMARELVTLHRINDRAATSLPPRLRAIVRDADALTHDGARLESALATLSDYIRNSSATGIDPAFLATQVQYLIGSTAGTKAAVADLAEQANRAQAAAGKLRQKR